MATQKDRELVAIATAKRAENPSYRPTLAELRAVDAVLIEQAQERLPASSSKPVIQPPTAAPAKPEKTLAERVAESLAAALAWVREMTGNLREVKPGGRYIGPITHADEHHAVQAQGRGDYAIHRQADLPKRLEATTASVDIQYGRDGRVVKLEMKPQQSRGLGRV